MTNQSFTVGQDVLERLAGRLRSGASDLERPAGDAPDTPDAGVSAPALVGALAEIGRAVIGSMKHDRSSRQRGPKSRRLSGD